MTSDGESARSGAFLHVAPAALSVACVFLLGTTSGSSAYTPDFAWSDKVGHLVAFAFVAYTHVRAGFFLFPKAARGTILISAGALSAFWGGALEVVQASLPYRTAEVGDFVADSLGVLLAVGLFWRGSR